MINFNCNIKVKHNFKNIEAITQKIPQIAKEITEDILKNIRGYAIRLEKGQNESGILVEMIDMSTKEVKRPCFCRPDQVYDRKWTIIFVVRVLWNRTICGTRTHRKNKAFY